MRLQGITLGLGCLAVAATCSEPVRVWQMEPHCIARGELVVCPAEQRVYYSDPYAITAVDTRTGLVLWSAIIDDGVSSNLVASGPVVAFSHGQETVSGLSRVSGRQAWALEVQSRELLAADRLIAAQTADREGVLAVDPATGRVAWRHRSPAGTDRAFLHLLAISPRELLTSRFSADVITGQVARRWTLKPPSEVTAGTFAGDLRILATSDGDLFAFGQGLDPLWRTRLVPAGEGSQEAPQLEGASDGILVATRTTLNAVRLQWLTLDGAERWSIAAYHRGAMIGLAGRRILVVSPGQGGRSRLQVLDSMSGKEQWSQEIDGHTTLLAGAFPCASDTCFLLLADGGGRKVVHVDLLRRVVRQPVI